MACRLPIDIHTERDLTDMAYLLENISDDEAVTVTESSIRDSQKRREVLSGLHDALGLMYKEEEFTDLEIKVQDKIFKCHRIIMAAMSGYFRSLLSSGMRESQNGQVELKEVSRSSLNQILLYIYYGENIVTGENVVELLKSSTFLQIKHLERECEEFMSRGLTPVNCISIWKTARTFHCPLLADKAWAIVLKDFAEVSRLEEFLCLDKEDFVAILEDDQLPQDIEDTICDAVLEWVKKDLASREEDFDELLDYVCLPKVSGQFLFDRVLSDKDMMERSPRFKQLADEALEYQLKPDKRTNIMARQSMLRNDPKLTKVVTLIGGYYISDDPLNCVLSFDLKRQKWYTVASVIHDPGEDFATCVYKNDIYLSGGSRSLDKFAMYSPDANDWFQQPALNTGRECHSMAVVGESIYVLGGRNSQQEEAGGLIEDIEAYNTRRGTWAKVGKLQVPLESLSSVVLKDKIYTFGGLNENREPSSAIQCFDPSTEACSSAGALPNPTEMTSAIVINSNIYIICSEGKVYRFNHSDSTVSEVANFEARSKFGLFVEGHNVVVVGGEKDGDTLTDEVLKIDVRSGQVTPADTKLPIPFGGFRMETLVVPKELLAQEGFNVMGQNLFDPELEYREQQRRRRWPGRHSDD